MLIAGGLGLEPSMECTRYAVVSQACDLLHHNLTTDGEPFVELLPLRDAVTPEGNFRNLKNPRRLQFELLHTSRGSVLHEANIHELIRCRREKLAMVRPSAEWSITGPEITMLKEWLSRRHRRPALPDAFNNGITRTDRKDRKFRQLAAELIDTVDDIYIRLDPEGELDDSQDGNYAVELLFAVRKIEDEEWWNTHTVAEELVCLLAGVDVVDERSLEFRVEYSDRITLGELKDYKLWDFDRVSYAGME